MGFTKELSKGANCPGVRLPEKTFMSKGLGMGKAMNLNEIFKIYKLHFPINFNSKNPVVFTF